MSGVTRKALNFDLRTKDLKQYYPGKHYRDAYKDIRKFLLQRGFKHRQWSGYISGQPMHSHEVRKMALEMSRTFPWLKKCVNRFDSTSVGKPHDLTALIINEGKSAAKGKDEQVQTVNDSTKDNLLPLFPDNSLRRQLFCQIKGIQQIRRTIKDEDDKDIEVFGGLAP